MGIDRIKYEELKKYKKTLVDQNYYIAEIDGNNIYNLEDYMNEIIKAFKFPDGMFKNINSFDSYLDWMTDFSWLYGKEGVDKNIKGYALFIYDFDKMMMNNPKLKRDIMDCFSDTIIPFWAEEVEHVVVEGKTKIFDVFVVD